MKVLHNAERNNSVGHCARNKGQIASKKYKGKLAVTIDNPHKHIGYLRDCLSNDKRPVGFLLGAGCPLSVKTGENDENPIIPDICGLTKAVEDAFQADTECGKNYKKIVSQLTKDGHSFVNIENILSHIRSLRLVAGEDKVRDLTAANLDELDFEVCEAIQKLMDKTLPGDSTSYHRIARWIGGTERELPVEIFTTNYDLLMEQALESYQIPFFDGFVGSFRPFFDVRTFEEDHLPHRWSRIWKLHGSINWCSATNGIVYRTSASEEGQRRLIHPSHLKYEESRRMPYLAMVDRLKAFLRQTASVLVICGYSFRDEHINEIIVQGLSATRNSLVLALMFGNISEYPEASRLARRQRNLSLLAKDCGIIGGRDLTWQLRREEVSKWAVACNSSATEANDNVAAILKLGDFSVLADFVNELIDNDQQEED